MCLCVLRAGPQAFFTQPTNTTTFFSSAQRPAQLLRHIKIPLTLNMCVAAGVVIDYEVSARVCVCAGTGRAAMALRWRAAMA